jgi:hypothetical protein
MSSSRRERGFLGTHAGSAGEGTEGSGAAWKGGMIAMADVELCCPYCETVMDQRFHLHMPEHVWYECPICGHRAVLRGDHFETAEDEEPASLRP